MKKPAQKAQKRRAPVASRSRTSAPPAKSRKSVKPARPAKSIKRTKPARRAPVPSRNGTAVHGKRARHEQLGIEVPLLLRMYRAMSMVRALDQRMLAMQRQGRIGFWGPVKGQEAATIGSCAAFEDQDWILPALREAGAALYRGFPLREMVAQCIGNSGDKTQGRQMPCHYTFKAKRYVAMSSVIGTQIPHAVGVAMAARIRGEKVVAAGYLGDGATSSTDFHAAMNFAQVYKAPVVLICQNNQWAISVPLSKQTAMTEIAKKARAYGMEGVEVDGNDVLEVYAATRRAVDKARRGDGPTFLELKTYRVLGHSSSDDPTRYRDAGEVERWIARDPLALCRKYLQDHRLWDAAREEEQDGQLAAEISQAVREAEALPPVDPKTLVEDVYADVTPALREQIERALDDLGGSR